MNSLNTLVDCNLRLSKKLTTERNKYTIPQFISSLNPIVEQNQFDHIIDSHNKVQNKINVIIRKKQSKQELVQYLHAACMSLTLSTFIKAIKNNYFISWLGLTPELVAKHLPKSILTI